MKNHYYKSGMHFEAFMRRALNTNEKSISKGTCGSIYETLIRIHDGTALVRTPYARQLETVKTNLNKGFDAFLKQQFGTDDKNSLMKLKYRLNDAYFVSDLDQIINQALEVIVPE
jgi:hypothetical protein